MIWRDLMIILAILFICVFTFKPAVRNFQVVLADRSNTKATPAVRKFVLFWMGLGIVSIVCVFFVMAYAFVLKIRSIWLV